MKFVKIIFALLIVAVLFKFNLDNKDVASVVFYHYTSPQIPLGLLLMTTLVLGMIAASFGSTIRIMQLKRQLKKLQPEGAAPVEKPKKKKKSKEKKGDDVAAEPVAPVAPASATATVPSGQDTSETVQDAIFEEDIPANTSSAPIETVKEAPDNGAPAVIELPANQPVDAEKEAIVEKNV